MFMCIAYLYIVYFFYPVSQPATHTGILLSVGIVINVVLNIVLNFKVCKTMGAKFLVKLGKWIMPFTSSF